MFARGRAHVCLADVCPPEMARFSPPLRGCVCDGKRAGDRVPFAVRSRDKKVVCVGCGGRKRIEVGWNAKELMYCVYWKCLIWDS